MKRVRATAVMVKDNHVLLIHRKNEKEYYVFPGGGVEVGELPKDAVLRELREETCVEAKVIKLLWHKIYEDTENYVYLCEYISGEPKLANDSPEKQEMTMGKEYFNPVWMKISDLRNIQFFPAIDLDQFIADFGGGF